MALTTSRVDTRPPEIRTPKRVRPRPLPELLLIVGLFLAYKLGRVIADGHVSRAMGNARDVWHLERILHLPSEVWLQHGMLSSIALTHIANIYYAVVHFPASIAFLLWLYIARPAHYVWVRRLMAVVTGLALAIHIAYPLAPPRMLTGVGLIDTAAKYGPSVYGPPSTDTLSNQYAAMPSLHVGWALILALGMVYATRGRWRWLWFGYPAMTFAVVLATANHYWLDGIVATIMICGLLPLARRWTRIMPRTTAPLNDTASLNNSVPLNDTASLGSSASRDDAALDGAALPESTGLPAGPERLPIGMITPMPIPAPRPAHHDAHPESTDSRSANHNTHLPGQDTDTGQMATITADGPVG